MLFRGTVTALVAMVALSSGANADDSTSIEVGGFARGQVCSMDSECAGNLDCQKTSRTEKRCLPISCAKGAGMALLDYGFNPDGYVNDVLEKAELNGRTQWRRFSEEEGKRLQDAIRTTEPPMEVFNQNFTACMNPEVVDGRRLEDAEPIVQENTAYGVQWGAAALFAYFGKWTSWEDEIFDNDVKFTMVQNCVGAMGGFDVGVDFLAQIINSDNDLDFDFSSRGQERFDPEFDYIHVLTAGPLGIQVGWFTESGAAETTFTEVTFGGSFGGGLGGYTKCFSDIVAQSDIIP